MRSKAPLALMEQAVMILVFALAAALCVQAFVFSNRTSQLIADRDRAAVMAQNAAELTKRFGQDSGTDGAFASVAEELGGSYDEGRVVVYYDGEWDTVSDGDGAAFTLTVDRAYDGQPGVNSAAAAVVRVSEGDRELFSLKVAWQEREVAE